MNWLRQIVSGLQATFRKRQRDAILDEELQTHLTLLIEQNIERGMLPVEARRAAKLSLGGADQIKESVREHRGLPLLETLWQDIRFGLRMLRKSPGFTAVAVLTLALGIGANTAIFSFVDSILLRPLPYRNASRLVAVWSAAGGSREERSEDSLADYTQIKEQSNFFEDVTCVRSSFATLTGQGDPADAFMGYVPSNFFSTFGVSPLYGRAFLPEEEKPDRNAVAILGYSLWRSNFGGDPAVVGKIILLDNKPYKVVGVMPALFHPSPEELWLPSSPPDDLQSKPDSHDLRILATLRKGESLRQAQIVLDVISQRVASEYPFERERHFRLFAEPPLRTTVQNVRGALLVLFGAVSLVLFIACANITSLVLGRGFMRQKEFAVRAAIGASRSRIVRQMLVESLLLSFLGGATGFLLAMWGKSLLLWIAPADTPRVSEVAMSHSVFLFAGITSLLAGIVFGLAPAFQFSKYDPSIGLKEGTEQVRKLPGMQGIGLQKLLIVSEIGLCFTLLVGAALTLRSLGKLLDVNFGFRTDHVLSLRIDFPKFKYKDFHQASVVVNQILQNIQSLPGVESASGRINAVLENGVGLSGFFGVEGHPELASIHDRMMQVRYVTSDYFRTLRIPIIEGRGFISQDDQSQASIAVVNEAFVRRYFARSDPVGKYLLDYKYHPTAQPTARDIIGVVGDVRDRDPSMAPSPTIYIPYSQFQAPDAGNVFLLVRTAFDPTKLVNAVEAQIWAVDKDLPIPDAETLDQEVSNDVSEPRFRAVLLGAFGALGLLLSVVGVYGLISYATARRTHEIGIRVALGAQPRDIVRMVLGEGLLLALIGIAIGFAGALALTRFLRSLLFEMKPTDPATFIGVAILLALVALAACYIPARRAMRVDPMVALRYE